MRIWDISPNKLCRNHLLGEHRELHAIWSILTKGKKGYRHHPETLRWDGKLMALYNRHESLVSEMSLRGYKHNSSLDESLAIGQYIQDSMVNSYDEQVRILQKKGCACKV